MREKKYKSSVSPQDGALAHQTDEGEALNMGSYAMVESAEVRTLPQPEVLERADAGVKRRSGVLTGATVRRMGIYLLGVLILAVGNTLSTRAQLGVSPIISPAYAISEIWHIDFGAATMGVYMVFMAVQFILQGKRTRKLDLLEIPFSLVFSFLLNFFTAGFDRLAVPLGLDTPALWQKILLLAGSVVCTGVGAAMIVAMDLVASPPDGMARAAGMAMGKGLGLGKNTVDVACVIVSVSLCMLSAGHVVGIGVGTLVAMVAIGRCVAVFNRLALEPMRKAAGLWPACPAGAECNLNYK